MTTKLSKENRDLKESREYFNKLVKELAETRSTSSKGVCYKSAYKRVYRCMENVFSIKIQCANQDNNRVQLDTVVERGWLPCAILCAKALLY